MPLKGGGDGHQNAHVACGPYPMGLTDVGDQDSAGLGRDGGIPCPQKFPGSLDNLDGKLAVHIVGVNRKGMAGREIKVDDLKVW